MGNPTTVVREFFDEYARGRSELNPDLIASQYPDSFMIAGPKGARPVEKSMIVAAFTGGRALLTAGGHTSTTVLSLDESSLDEHYTLVRAAFVWRFQKAPAPPIDVRIASTFVLSLDSGGPRIVFQHEHEDFQQALRASGVLPAQP